MNDREALGIALDALMNGGPGNEDITEKAIKIVEDQLKKPERKWTELTVEDIEKAYRNVYRDEASMSDHRFADELEFILRERNADK